MAARLVGMSLRHAVLATLHLGPQSGYDLAKKFDDVMRGVWYARKNQMYGELAKLTEDGFARVADSGPRGRQTYAVTEAGRAELRRWLTGVEPDRTVRDERMLRAYLMPLLGDEDALAVLRREEAALAAEHRDLGAYVELLRGREAPTDPQRAGLGLRVRLLGAALDWTRDMIAVRESAPASRGG